MLSQANLVFKPVGLQVLIPENFHSLSKTKTLLRDFLVNSSKKNFVHQLLITKRRIGAVESSLGGSGDFQGVPGGEAFGVADAPNAAAGRAFEAADAHNAAAGPSEQAFRGAHAQNAAARQAFGAAEAQQQDGYGKLVSAVALIMGTAVGPGILGLPAATLPAGLQASSLMILAAWAYVTASILLVAELSCAVMADEGQKEVSFTGLVSHTLGYKGACAVAVVYASLNYALLVACIAGLGSILQAWLSLPLSVSLLSAASAAVVGILVAFAPFKIIDGVNRGLCGLMIAAITSLVGLGVYAGRELSGIHQLPNNVTAFSSVLQALPVTVLTLGFHVITPVICRVVGGRPEDARRAIFLGGAIPLAMVLAWNAVVLGLAPPTSTALDPIKLLLNVSESAASFVQAFAFSALGTTLIGYALSFPKQLGDAFQLLRRKSAFYVTPRSGDGVTRTLYLEPLIWALAPPAAVAVFWPTAFASSLDFAGIYANCFLFGVLPPVMAWVYRYPQTTEASRLRTQHKPLLPGGKMPLLVLLGISILLAIRPGLGGN